MKKACKHKDFYGIDMSSENYKILEFNQYMESDKWHTLFRLTWSL